MEPVDRRLTVGAEPTTYGTTHFRVWAPRRRQVELVLESGPDLSALCYPLEPEGDGFYSVIAHVGPGARYRFRLDRLEPLYPDPASRFQPGGPFGSSQVIDPTSFTWTDAGWHGPRSSGHVIYELHVGTFTPEGTWAAAMAELPALAEVGVTLLEVMPVADFPGKFGWGYDGVNLFAPTRMYGEPDDFRRFVDRAHHLGLGVLLDVVYNHLGPAGNFLGEFAEEYVSTRYQSEWGDALNFDGPGSGPVRAFFAANAGYWIDEFHLDGLRLDATQQIFDASPRHLVAEVVDRVHRAARGRRTFVVAENEPQESWMLRPSPRAGASLDALWNDDFHHAARVALTGRDEAYYTDYLGSPQEFVSSAKYGFLYQGQHYSWQGKRRGQSTRGLPPGRFVAFLENHDQVANAVRGERLHQQSAPAKWRAMTALLLLQPATPMLFQGQEFGSSAPFLYFADHEPGLAAAIEKGRAEFLGQFPSLAHPGVSALLSRPDNEAVFRRCKLDHGERGRHRSAWLLHRDLLRIRHRDPVIARQGSGGFDGAVLGPAAFLLRWFDEEEADGLLLVNLGQPLHLTRAPEPLLAPPAGRSWAVTWTSEDPCYGGTGIPPVETADRNWYLPGDCAILLHPDSDATAAG
jgi:maltooligosyltrehalose trehalohydrolase